MANGKGKMVCDEIFRSSIGHYGGLFVEIPAEHYASFKSKFSPREFPKKAKLKNMADTLTVQGEERFHKKNPKSLGKYYDVFFADRSKGLKTLESHLDKCNWKVQWKTEEWSD